MTMRGEARFVAVILAVAALTANFPYILGPFLAPPDHKFMGFVYNPDEQNVYLVWIRQHAEGHLLARNPFTTEGPQVGFFNLFLFLLGVISRLLHVDPVWLWHISRVCGCFALLLAGWGLSRRLSGWALGRRISLYLLAFASGLGWLKVLEAPFEGTDYKPRLLGLITPETVNFLSMLTNPLFALSIALELLCLSFWLDATRSGGVKEATKCGAMLLLLGNIHTYDLAALLPTVALHAFLLSIWRRSARLLLLALLACSLSLPSLGLQVATLVLDPVFKEKALTATPIQPLQVVAITFGLPLLGWLFGGALGLTKAGNKEAVFLLLLWPICALGAAHLPVSFQRKALEGAQCSFALLSGYGLAILAASVRRRGLRAVKAVRAGAVVFVLLCLPSNAFFLSDLFLNLAENNALLRPFLMPRFYLSKGQIEAAKFLERAKREGDVALSVPTYANYLPRLSGISVFAGHWAETLRYPEKVRIIPLLYSERAPEEWRVAYLRAHKVKFVLYGPEEREYGFDSPGEGGWARLVAKFGDTEVYEVGR